MPLLPLLLLLLLQAPNHRTLCWCLLTSLGLVMCRGKTR